MLIFCISRLDLKKTFLAEDQILSITVVPCTWVLFFPNSFLTRSIYITNTPSGSKDWVREQKFWRWKSCSFSSAGGKEMQWISFMHQTEHSFLPTILTDIQDSAVDQANINLCFMNVRILENKFLGKIEAKTNR